MEILLLTHEKTFALDHTLGPFALDVHEWPGQLQRVCFC